MPDGWTDPITYTERVVATDTAQTLIVNIPKGWIMEILSVQVSNRNRTWCFCHVDALDLPTQVTAHFINQNLVPSSFVNDIGVANWHGKAYAKDRINTYFEGVAVGDTLVVNINGRIRRLT